MIEYAVVKFTNPPSQRKQNKKQYNFDHKQAANKIKCSAVRIEARNIKNNFLFGGEVNEKCKNSPQPLFRPISVHACQQSSSTSRDPVPLPDHCAKILTLVCLWRV
jgi:hypothetical protein